MMEKFLSKKRDCHLFDLDWGIVYLLFGSTCRVNFDVYLGNNPLDFREKGLFSEEAFFSKIKRVISKINIKIDPKSTAKIKDILSPNPSQKDDNLSF